MVAFKRLLANPTDLVVAVTSTMACSIVAKTEYQSGTCGGRIRLGSYYAGRDQPHGDRCLG